MSRSVSVLEGGTLPACFVDAAPPPVRLHVWGTLPPGRAPRVAVVGSRAPSPTGLWAGYRFGFDLARAGVVVVSGLARGVDAAAHRGAIDAGGPTVAFLGSGWDALPRRSRELAEAVAGAGAVVSEYAPDTTPRPFRFVHRNRLIAAYARAALVVEAGETSGALITAGFTLERGGLLWAVPGDPRRPTCRGSNRLIRDGVGVALEAADVLAGLGLVGAGEGDGATPPPGLDPEETRVWKAVRDRGCIDPEGLARATRLPVAALLRALSSLELTGVLERTPGGYTLPAKGASGGSKPF